MKMKNEDEDAVVVVVGRRRLCVYIKNYLLEILRFHTVFKHERI